MALTIKKLTLWRGEIANRPGVLAATLEPLAAAGCDLEVVMAYEKPGDSGRSVIELAPVAGATATRAARTCDLSGSQIPCLVVDGDNRRGLGHAITSSLGEAGINLQFTVALVAGRRFRTVFGFGPEVNLATATRAIRSGASAPARSRSTKARPSGSRPARSRHRTGTKPAAR